MERSQYETWGSLVKSARYQLQESDQLNYLTCTHITPFHPKFPLDPI